MESGFVAVGLCRAALLVGFAYGREPRVHLRSPDVEVLERGKRRWQFVEGDSAGREQRDGRLDLVSQSQAVLGVYDVRGRFLTVLLAAGRVDDGKFNFEPTVAFGIQVAAAHLSNNEQLVEHLTDNAKLCDEHVFGHLSHVEWPAGSTHPQQLQWQLCAGWAHAMGGRV